MLQVEHITILKLSYPFLYLCLFVCLSVCQVLIFFLVFIYVCPMSATNLSVLLMINLSSFLLIWPLFYLSVTFPASLSVSIPIFLSVCLFVCPLVWLCLSFLLCQSVSSILSFQPFFLKTFRCNVIYQSPFKDVEKAWGHFFHIFDFFLSLRNWNSHVATFSHLHHHNVYVFSGSITLT